MSKVYIYSIQKLEELQNIYNIICRAYNPPLDVRISDFEGYVIKLFNNANNFYACIDDDIVGVISYYANDNLNKIAYITQIAVMEQHRNKGVGQLLLNNCIELSKEKGMGKVKLQVRLNNKTAIKFYRKNGFKGTELLNDGTMFMIKNIY